MKYQVLTIGDINVHAEVADTEELRQNGLMYRDSLEQDKGMLFVFDESDRRGFWMKNTRIPLSIAFLSDSGEILNIENMQPYDEASSYSVSPSKCALEMNQGWFRRNGIKSGDVVSGINQSETVMMTELKIRQIVRNILTG